jgi:hypothetical protein
MPERSVTVPAAALAFHVGKEYLVFRLLLDQRDHARCFHSGHAIKVREGR